jgi:hypothetical protein
VPPPMLSCTLTFPPTFSAAARAIPSPAPTPPNLPGGLRRGSRETELERPFFMLYSGPLIRDPHHVAVVENGDHDSHELSVYEVLYQLA